MDQIYESYDIAVVGAGHAGCEAALACARLSFRTVLFTVSTESIALMPCNPNIGGPISTVCPISAKKNLLKHPNLPKVSQQ